MLTTFFSQKKSYHKMLDNFYAIRIMILGNRQPFFGVMDSFTFLAVATYKL